MYFLRERLRVLDRIEGNGKENRNKWFVWKRKAGVDINAHNALGRGNVRAHEFNRSRKKRQITGTFTAGEVKYAAGKRCALSVHCFIKKNPADGFTGQCPRNRPMHRDVYYVVHDRAVIVPDSPRMISLSGR